MKVQAFNLKGEKTTEIELKDSVFGITPNDKALAQYIRVYQVNQRQGNASTKTRAQVSGGGKKPWAQKHTGKARQGSTRSPIWVHGGVAFGPKPKDWNLKISKSLKELAMKSILSQKAKEEKIMVLDEKSMKKPSTKEFAQALNKMKIEGKTLFVWIGKDENFVKSARNIDKVAISFSGSLNAYDVINSRNVIFMKDALTDVEKRFK